MHDGLYRAAFWPGEAHKQNMNAMFITHGLSRDRGIERHNHSKGCECRK